MTDTTRNRIDVAAQVLRAIAERLRRVALRTTSTTCRNAIEDEAAAVDGVVEEFETNREMYHSPSRPIGGG